jgi:co-chaperonin GroES (HSP10)
MKAHPEKIVVNMIFDNDELHKGLILPKGVSEKPKGLVGVVELVGDDVKHIKVGDIVIAPIVIGMPYKLGDSIYKIMPAKDVLLIFDSSEMETVKGFKPL